MSSYLEFSSNVQPRAGIRARTLWERIVEINQNSGEPKRSLCRRTHACQTNPKAGKLTNALQGNNLDSLYKSSKPVYGDIDSLHHGSVLHFATPAATTAAQTLHMSFILTPAS